MNIIESWLQNRAQYVLTKLDFKFLPTAHFYIAGGCFDGSKPIADIDVYSASIAPIHYVCEAICNSRNAATYKASPWNVQVCNYYKPSLKALVDSFDFAHVQAGVHVRMSTFGFCSIQDVYYTADYTSAHVMHTTWYTGSEYPLSSLIRCAKYLREGRLSKGTYIRELIKILKDVIDRGFVDYEDFKDQLDAVDLGLVPEELEKLDFDELMRLFALLRKN